METLAIIMPVYNEEEAIGAVLDKWIAAMDQLGISYAIHPYNDGSKDNSQKVIEVKAAEYPGKVIAHSKPNSGHGPTILQGYREAAAAGYDWVFQIDSDDEMGPEGFSELWNKRENYDFLVGIRDGRKQALPRKIISAVSRLSVRLFYGKSIWDVNTPYRLMRVSAFQEIWNKIPPDTFAPNVIISGMAACKKLCCFETRVPQKDRQTGEVSIKKWKLLKAAMKSFCQTVIFSLTGNLQKQDTHENYIRRISSNFLRTTHSICLFSVFAFVISCLCAYPYPTHTDALSVFAEIYQTGKPWVACWYGWYIPELWAFLYRYTHCMSSIGILTTGVYWFSITLLYLSLFDIKKVPRWCFFLFVCWPGAVLFSMSISNNSLYLVMLLTCFAFYAFYRNRNKKWYIAFLSILFLLQCIFIRREAIFFVCPLCVLVLTLELTCLCRKIYAFFLAVLITIFCLGGIFQLEHKLTSHIAGYHCLNAVQLTAFYDLSCMSYYRKENLIPENLLKPEIRHKKNEFLKYIPDPHFRAFSEWHFNEFGRRILLQNVGNLNLWKIEMKYQDFLPVYLKNIPSYFQHRLLFLSDLLYNKHNIVTTGGYTPDMGTFIPPKSNSIPEILGKIWNYFPPACIYYWGGVICLFLCLLGKISFHSKNEKTILCGILICAIGASCFTLAGAVSPQIRYIAPLFFIIYYTTVTILIRGKYTGKKRVSTID